MTEEQNPEQQKLVDKLVTFNILGLNGQLSSIFQYLLENEQGRIDIKMEMETIKRILQRIEDKLSRM